MASEKNFETRVKVWLAENDIWHVKFFANRNTRVGVPDILACVGGRFVGIELKGRGGRPSAIQLWHCSEINRCGGVAVVAWPQDFEQLKELLTRLKRGEEVDDLIFEGVYLH